MMQFDSKYYCASLEKDKLKFQTKSQVTLIENLRFSYSTCEIYNIRNPLIDPQQIDLDHVTDLQVGDSVIVTNNMYGGAALRTFWISAEIIQISDACISIDVGLPPHIMRYSQGLIVLRRTGYYDNLPIENLREKIFLGGAIFSFDVHCDHFKMQVKIQMFENSPHIEVKTKTTYLENCKLFHQGIVIESPLALRDLHLKNRELRELKAKEPLHDVWLWKEGCRVGSPEGEWIIQHTPDIACLEVITSGRGFPWKTVTPTEKPQVVINLEHYQAQRFRQISMPHYDDIYFSEFKECSAPHYVKGDEINRSFKIFLGSKLPPIPRLMLTPKGFRASHVWAEHADRTNINTHRAAYYGDERILDAAQAVGGFVKYGHVVTKSIFHNNSRAYSLEYAVSEVDSNPHASRDVSDTTTIELSYKTDSEFSHFIDELNACGHEICLHSAAPDNASPYETYKAIVEIAKRYNSPTWIDHFYQRIRACVSYEGAVPHSPYSMLEAWRDNNIRYFWHAASEDFMPKKKDGIDLLHNSSGDYTPTPLYWRISAMPGDMITWAANECPLDYYKEEVIDDLIKNKGISIHHHYYPYIEEGADWSNNGFNFIEKNQEQRYVATQAFNHVLYFMALKKKEGELYITTIKDLVSYWLALEHIEIELSMPNSFILTNKGEQKIEGLSFVVRADKVTCSQTSLQSRFLDHGDLLVWLDMPAGAHYQFTIHNDVQLSKDSQLERTPLNNNFIDDREKKNA